MDSSGGHPEFSGHLLDRQAALHQGSESNRAFGDEIRSAGALEAEGYLYTPFIDIGTEDYIIIQNALADTDAPGFSIDLHAMGNNGGSLVTVGASVAPFRRDRFDLMLQENTFFSFEYMVHSQLAERPGLPVSINIEGNHLITGRGVEYLHPRNERILEIR